MMTRNPLFRSSVILTLALSPVLASCDSGPSDPIAAAQQAIADGEPRSALEYATFGLEKDPSNPALLLLAAEAAMAIGQPDRAITELEKVPESAEQYQQARARLAQAQIEGNYLQAAGQTLETLEPDTPLVHRVLVMFHLANGEVGTAFEKLDAGLSAFPDDPVLITYDADRIWTAGRIDDAQERLAPVLAITPTVYEAHLFAGKTRLALRDLDEAEGHFKKVLLVRPVDQTAMLAMAAIANDRGDREAANNWLNKIGESVEPSPAWALFEAQMAYEADDLDRAFGLIETVPPALASEPEFVRLRGLIDARRDQHAMAALSLGKYVDETGGDVLTRQLLARSLGEEGQYAEAWKAIAPTIDHPQMDLAGLALALQLAERSSKKDVSRVEALIKERQAAPVFNSQMVEAGKAIRAGEWAKADAIYAPLVAGEGKNDPALLNNAAAVKSKLGKQSEAVVLARRALAQAPSSPEIMDTLGWALWQQGESTAEARAMLTKARESAPGNREIAEHWAIAHAE